MFDLFKGGKTSVKLTLDRPVSEDATQVYPYYPGETVHASVMLVSEKEVKIREGRIALIYHEEYQYKHHHRTTDSHGHSRTTVATAWATDEREINRQVFLGETSLPAGTQKTFEFDLPIPSHAAPSAQAEIVHIEWMVKATLDRKMAGDIEDKVDLPVFTGASGTSAQPVEVGVSNEPDEADLIFSLPGKEWVMGEMIAGRLQISPKKEFDVTEIRVELVRRERVPRDLGNEHETSMPVKLSDGTRLVPGQSLSLLFNIAIPTPVPATFSTPNSTLDWVLKGVLARRLRKDTFVEEKIIIYNGRQR
jgi:Arrestin (or S-antigen), N-terminal domain